MATQTASLPAPAPSRNGHEEGAGLTLRAGARLGDYRLLAPIGTGGMAYVWAATRSGDYGFTRLFAIKAMRDEIALDPSFRRMFLEEAKLAARIHHTNVVDVLDLGEEAGVVYQVMPLIEGDSLAKLVRAHEDRDPSLKIPRSVAVRVVVDALRGLHAAHEMTGDDGAPLAIVHRDVSPHNVLVGIDGVAKIADFGVAKAMGMRGDESESGTLNGKLAYMSPEQLERGRSDKGEVDRRSDLFSTGVMLWELLAGQRLTPSAAATLLAGGALPDPRDRDPSVPEALAALTMRALARDPAARFATADAMADALEEAARGCGLALSTKEVASWTSPLATRTLARRRDDVAEAAGTLGLTLPVSVVDVVPGPKAKRKRRAVVAIAMSMLAIGLAIGGLAVRSGSHEAPPRDTLASAESAQKQAESVIAAPSTSSAATLTTATTAASTAMPTTNASAATVDAGAPSRTPAPSVRGRRVPEAAHPKFGNPYAR